MCLLNVRPSASFRDCDAARKPKQLPTPGLEGSFFPCFRNSVIPYFSVNFRISVF